MILRKAWYLKVEKRLRRSEAEAECCLKCVLTKKHRCGSETEAECCLENEKTAYYPAQSDFIGNPDKMCE